MQEITIGAVGAAIIAALVSLFGLIIGKEQKTSEFRQAWIDALRVEIANYGTSINAISDKLQTSYSDQPSKIASLSTHYNDLNRSDFGIRLRVNPEEKSAKALIAAMDKFENLAHSDENFVPANIKPVEAEFLLAAQTLLKHEWRRVKAGEKAFRVTKLTTIGLLITMLGLATFLWLAPTSGQGEPKAPPSSTSTLELVPGTQLQITVDAPNVIESTIQSNASVAEPSK